MSEVRMTRPRRNNQIVVVQVPLRRLDNPALHTKAGHLRHQDLDIFVGPQNRPDRSGDLSRRKSRRRDLIQQWLKSVIVPAVNHRNLYWRLGEFLRGIQSAETSADD